MHFTRLHCTYVQEFCALHTQAAKLQSEMHYQKRSKLGAAIQKLEEEVLADKERLKQLKKVNEGCGLKSSGL